MFSFLVDKCEFVALTWWAGWCCSNDPVS